MTVRGVKSVDRRRLEPLYRQVEVALRERILGGEWPYGSKIPSEDQLCKAYGVSRITVRQAIRTLVEDGYLERGRGRGTFVREPTLTAGVRGLRSFSEEMRALGLEPGARVLSIGIVKATELVSDRLGIDIGEPIIQLKRLRTGDGKPIGLQVVHLPADRFPGLEHEDLEGRSLYAALQGHYKIRPREAQETFWVARVGKEEAELLQVARGACAFQVERIATDEHSAIEFTASLMRGDRYRIHWILRNDDGESSSTKE
jgi:GntR family transcriptional regulator